VATGLTKGAALGELCNLKAKDALMGFLQVASVLFFTEFYGLKPITAP
jgi:hypothetical protein